MVFFLTVLLLSSPISAGEQGSDIEWLSFEPEIVVLEGLLEEKQFYGPPNYGENPETDRVEFALILALSAPVSVLGVDEGEENIDRRTAENVTQIQLVCEVEQVDCRDVVAKNVQVRGTLFSAYTGHHRARILMTVSEISEIE